MNNLRKFANEAEYSAATLNYPAVSWVVSGDTVHYDLSSGTPVVNDKVIIAAYDGSGESNRMAYFNCYAASSGDITSITIDNVSVNPIVCEEEGSYDAGQTYIIKYGLNTTTINDWCSGSLACTNASAVSKIDLLLPSQITYINYLPSELVNLVVEAENPAACEFGMSGFSGSGNIYVPDNSVNAYKSDSIWIAFANKIYPISEYSGNLPI